MVFCFFHDSSFALASDISKGALGFFTTESKVSNDLAEFITALQNMKQTSARKELNNLPSRNENILQIFRLTYNLGCYDYNCSDPEEEDLQLKTADYFLH
ncbi:hypothetical protein ACTXT7_012655 [Hymenolepis weldensis]